VVWVLAALLLLQACLLVYSARVHSPTWDETGHLAAGISHWELGRFDLYSVNPPLVRTLAAAPVYWLDRPLMDWQVYRADPSLRTEVYLGRRMIELNGADSMRYFFHARLAVLPFALIGTLLCFAWGYSLFGPREGLVAAFFWCFSPTVLAYGAIITPDLAAAVVMLGASYVFWCWLRSPTVSWSMVLAGVTTVAMLTKSIWLILPLVYLVIWGVHLWLTRGQTLAALPALVQRASWVGQAGMLVGACLVSVLLVNAFYGFAGTFRPLGSYQFVSSLLAGPPECEDCAQQPGNRFKGSWSGAIPLPLPANFVMGLDVQRRDFERGRTDTSWQSYLAGRWSQGGWWYYYVLGLFYKVPLITWLMIGAGSIAALFWRPPVELRVGALCLWLPALALLVLLSVNTGLNRYVRYAIPVLPVLIIWGAQVARYARRSRWWVSLPVGVSCLCLGLVSVSNAPHWLSYFNMAAGGPRGGYELLCDSNVDWGQDLPLVQAWLQEHPEAAKELRLAYFGSFDPAALGVEFALPAPLYGDAQHRLRADQLRMGPHPGWHIISKNYVVGHTMPVPDGSLDLHFQFFPEAVFSYFRHFEPVGEIGRSMFVYHLSWDDVNSFRLASGIAPLKQTEPSVLEVVALGSPGKTTLSQFQVVTE
jgi:energy-converting hydrogenase Eha subunit B